MDRAGPGTALGVSGSPRRGKSGCAQRRPRGMEEAAGSKRGCGWVTGGGGDCTSGAPGAHGPRTAHRPRALSSGGRGGGSGRRGGGARRREGRGVAPSAGGECYVGAAPPDPSPGGRADGRGRGGALAGPGGGGRGAGRPGLPHLPPPPAGPPQLEGDGSARRLALCAARRRPQPVAGGFVLARPGRGPGGFQARAPLPRTGSPQLPRARALLLRRRRRLLLRPPGLPAGSRPGGGGCSPSPGPEPPRALRAGRRRDPLAIRPGAPRTRAPLHSFRCRRGRPAGAGGEAGGGEPAGVGFQAVSHGPLPPRAHPSRPAGLGGVGNGCPRGAGRDPQNPKRSAGTRALPKEQRKGDSEAECGARRGPAGLLQARERSAGDAGETGRPPFPPRPPAEVGQAGTSDGAGPGACRAGGHLQACWPLGPRNLSLNWKDQILEAVTATLPPKLGVRQGRPPTAAKQQPPPAPFLKRQRKIRKPAREKEALGKCLKNGAGHQAGIGRVRYEGCLVRSAECRVVLY